MSLIIGLAIRRDFADCRILDLLLMYERRIESSLYKATAELRKMQKIRRERKTTDEGREMMDESIPVKQSQFEEEVSENHPQATLEAATPKKEMTDERRETRDESDSAKHPASLESYAVKKSQNARFQPEILNSKSEILNAVRYTLNAEM